MESATSTSTSTTSMVINSKSEGDGVIIIKKSNTNRIKIQNPFTFKVLQVFTGFGIGCGLGIGVGQPLNLGAIPVLSEVTRAASGATQAFSGVGRHVNTSLKKIGAKNIEAGIGCGVGFGHGFGIGLAVKPGVMQQMQLFMMEAMGKMMTKFGVTPDLSIGQGLLPASVQSSMKITQGSFQDTVGSTSQFGKNALDITNQDTLTSQKVNAGGALNLSGGSRTEKLINGLLKDPVLRGEELHAKDDELQSENRILRMVVKHQQVIEELMDENERLRQILVEDLKVSPSKLQGRQHSSRNMSMSTCNDCFECRRKQRRK